MIPPVVIHESFLIYRLVPPEANQGWKMELFEMDETIPSHYHKIQRQFLLTLEGELKVIKEGEILLGPGELVQVEPGILHSIIPQGKAKFLAVDVPGFNYPEDVFEDEPEGKEEWSPLDITPLPVLDKRYFGERIDLCDYAVYDLVNGASTANKWSIALLEIHTSPRHFHKIEREHFIVVSGLLDIEIEGARQILGVGEAVTIKPGAIHKLESANEEAVRVLCFNFPAFDPSDMHSVNGCA